MLNGVNPSDKVFKEIKPWIKPASIALANLEIPTTHSKVATVRKTPAELKARQQYILKASPAHMPYIVDTGFDLVSLANNHGMDFGYQGLREMTQMLDKADVKHAGAGKNAAEAMRVSIVTLPNGKKVGLISALAFVSTGGLRKCTPATYTTPGINVLSFGGKIDAEAKARLKRWIAGAKEGCDVLVVGLHWGIERQTLPTAYQVSLGRACVEGGADVVWGHHPHVIQGGEWYKGKPILYSMGNLVSPTPAKSGFVQFEFSGTDTLAAKFFPTLISGGRVTPSKTDLSNYPALCAAIQKRYGVAESRALVAQS